MIATEKTGLDGLARFLRLHRSGQGDYTRKREEWQRGISVDEIARSIRLCHRENGWITKTAVNP